MQAFQLALDLVGPNLDGAQIESLNERCLGRINGGDREKLIKKAGNRLLELDRSVRPHFRWLAC